MTQNLRQLLESYPGDQYVRETKYPGTTKVNLMLKRTDPRNKGPLKMEKGGWYLNTMTGERIPRHKRRFRTSNPSSIYRTMGTINGLILSNFYGEQNEFLVTLTYKKSCKLNGKSKSDTKRSTRNIQSFFTNLRRCLTSEKLNPKDLKFLWVREPHKDGSFHFHILMKLLSVKKVSKSVSDKVMRAWRFGKVDIRIIDQPNFHVDKYFMATVKDLEASSSDSKVTIHNGSLRERKSISKGKRLKLYPHNAKIFGYSQNLDRPVVRRGNLKDYQFSKLARVTNKKTVTLSKGDLKIKVDYVTADEWDKGMEKITKPTQESKKD